MDASIIAAIIAFVGVVLSVSISLTVALISRRYNYNQLFAETVSQNRMDWINVWRENISEFLAIAEEIHHVGNISQEQGIAFKKARNMILTRLNLNEYPHCCMEKAIEDMVANLSNNSKSNEFNECRDAIISLAHVILKQEWERVKREAKGKK